MHKVEKIIHCVWIGGGNLEAVKGLEGIRSWLDHAPDYRIVLWTDPQRQLAAGVMGLLRTNRDVNKAYIQRQRKDIGHKPFKLEWCDADWRVFLDELHALFQAANTAKASEVLAGLIARIEAIPATAEANMAALKALEGALGSRFEVRDIATLRHLPRRAYAIEMSNRGLNFAGASDIIRYAALLEHGGLYLDVDLRLKEDIGEISLPPQAMLAAIEPAKGVIRAPIANSPFQQATAIFGQDSAYVMNNALIAHAGSAPLRRMVDWIAAIYDLILPADGSNPAALTISAYWHLMPTKSTLDITGPNLVRDVLFYDFSQETADFPQWCRRRLSLMLKALESSKNAYEKQFFSWRSDDTDKVVGILPFNRHAMVWPDGQIIYQPWWDWFLHNALFPMDIIDFESAYARPSSTSALLSMKY